MKKLLSSMLCSFIVSTSLMGFDPLNEMDYHANIKKSAKTRNATITLTQDEKTIATATSFWNLAQYPGKATYVLKDADKKVVASARAYLKESQPYNLNFDLVEANGRYIGTLILSYNQAEVEKTNATVPSSAVLFSKEGIPLMEDKFVWSFYTHLCVDIPGTKDRMADIQCDSFFWNNPWHAKIADLSYVAQMNISPELFLLYYAIRSDYYNYQYQDIANVNTVR